MEHEWHENFGNDVLGLDNSKHRKDKEDFIWWKIWF